MDSSRIRSELTIESLLAETPTNMSGIVETVPNICRVTVRVLLIPHFHFVNVRVAGVQALSTSLAPESKLFAETQVLHRDVKICVLRGPEKHNTIVGSVCYLGGDLEETFLALELIKKSYAKYGDWSEHMMEANEKRKLKIADYEAREGRSRVWKDYSPPPTALNRIRDQDLEGQVVQIVSGDHIIVAVTVAVADGTEQYYEVYLSGITCPRLGGAGVKPRTYSNEAKEFVRAHLIGRQVLVELEYSRMPCTKTDTNYYHGSIFLENAHGSPSQNVSRLSQKALALFVDIRIWKWYQNIMMTFVLQNHRLLVIRKECILAWIPQSRT